MRFFLRTLFVLALASAGVSYDWLNRPMEMPSGGVDLSIESGVSARDVAVRIGNCQRDGFKVLMECRWVATDCCGNTSEFRIFIKSTDNLPPTLVGIPRDITLPCGATTPTVATVTASDNCDANASVVFVETRRDGTCPSNYTLTRTWTSRR